MTPSASFLVATLLLVVASSVSAQAVLLYSYANSDCTGSYTVTQLPTGCQSSGSFSAEVRPHRNCSSICKVGCESDRQSDGAGSSPLRPG